jgi:hypothetical protein
VDFFDALAVFGAIGACAEVYSIWRDRPRLVVNFGTTTSTKEPPSVWITVLNDGRQPITVRSAGFYGSEFPIEVETQEFGHGTGTATYEFPMIREPVLLDPGRLHNETALIPNSFGYGYHVDYPLRAYAVDARGRRVWGDAEPVVRMIVGGGPCPERFPAHLWEPTRKPLCSCESFAPATEDGRPRPNSKRSPECRPRSGPGECALRPGTGSRRGRSLVRDG